MLLSFSSLSELSFSDFESLTTVDLADVIAQLRVQMTPIYAFKAKNIYQNKQIVLTNPIAKSVFTINTIIETKISNYDLIETKHTFRTKAIYVNNDM